MCLKMLLGKTVICNCIINISAALIIVTFSALLFLRLVKQIVNKKFFLC